jgi:chromosome segregation ATPase
MELNEQLTSTVRMYNSLISDLKAELSAARKEADDIERRRASDIKQLTAQNSLDDDQLKQTLDEYKGMIKDLKQQLDAAKRKDNDKDTNHQRQRLILIQTNDHLQAELDALRRQVEEQKQQQQQQQQRVADGNDASTTSSLQNNSRDD